MADDDKDMHRQVDWLRPSDRPILAEFRKYSGWLKPASIHLNIAYSQQHIQERCRELWQRGLLERYDQNTAAYRLTELGERFVEDEVSVETLQDLHQADEGPYGGEE